MIAEKPTKTEKIKESSIEMLDRYKQDIQKDADVVLEQRDKANEDMRFVNVVGGMWEGFLEDQFNDRTKLEFDIISNYIQRYIGQWNQSRVGVEYKANDRETSDEDADLINGIYRADFREFSGKMSIDNAVDEQATCGYGAFKLATKFVDEEDPENDHQRIEWRPVHNAYNSIYWDKAAKRIDKRDAVHCTELISFTPESFSKKYPDKDPVSAYHPNSRRFYNVDSADAQSSLVYVAKRYEIKREEVNVFVYSNLLDGKVEVYSEEDHKLIEEELETNEFKNFLRKRKILKQSVYMTVFSGADILEKPRRVAGKYIPIIPVYGYHAYIDGCEWYRGLVRKLMDAARLYNMQISQLAENSASTGQEIPIFDPSQMEGGISELWADRNTKPYLLARALRDNDGNIVAHGPTSYLKPSALDANSQSLLQIVPSFVAATTGGAPQDTIDPNASGKAINALQKREDLNTQAMFDNIANAIEWSGSVYESMAQEVYSEKRSVNTISKDGTESTKELLKNVLDEKTGRLTETNNLEGKKFRVYSDVGPQYDTLRQQTVDDLKSMLEVLRSQEGGQQYTDAIIATILENVTGVGLGPLKDIVRRNMLMQGIVKPETEQEQEMVAASQQPQGDPQAELVAAAAQQAIAEARERESKVLDNTASAQLKQVKAQKTLNDIQIDNENVRTKQITTLADIRNQVFENVQRGTLQ
tara:strand:+ start:444 stop:2546 length:2103 start_codon:yes stop_codon:yes gene_type:complete